MPSGFAKATGSTFRPALRPSAVERAGDGSFLIRFDGDEPVETLLEKAGRMPLPPYIASKRSGRRSRPRRLSDGLRARGGAVAAPTAALHFTDRLFERWTNAECFGRR
jgi:S-adenosylmethionine:tRNA ribosyltransferase-isomerase